MENMKLERFEVVKCGPYRFIGRVMYIRAGDDLSGEMWGKKWIFDKLDTMKEYDSDLEHRCALVSWEKYDERYKLMGYTVGKFMKPDTPVPEDMDYHDIPEGYVAKGFIHGGNDALAQKLLKEELSRQGKYKPVTSKWSAEVYPLPFEAEVRDFGSYIACELN